MESGAKPSVLLVYYSYTHQTVRVLEAMADVLRDRGCEATLAGIEFVDPRYAERFATFPMSHPFLQVLGMIPAELRRRPAEIRVPDAVTEQSYDPHFEDGEHALHARAQQANAVRGVDA